jgi:DNA transposition AAA+ family ATPase
MTNEQKQQIVDAANAYCIEKGLSQSEISRQTGINAGYLSNMLKGTFKVSGGDIADKWFFSLADFIGFSTKKVYWEPIATPQFMQIINALESAKEHQLTKMLIGPTGCGKTFAIDKFCNIHPVHTYRITISSLYNLGDLVAELMDKVKAETVATNPARMNGYSLKVRVDKIIDKLIEVKRSGGKPIIIIDEGENMEISLLKMFKALYDALKDYCAIVLIGTERLRNRMLNKNGNVKGRNREALPELYRRFKAGDKNITPIDQKFTLILDKYVDDKGLRKLLTELCANYGELHDFLEPALREADQAGQPLTEQFFRLKYDMPKY